MEQLYHFSAPGRTEISGNHTDHQHGCVLAAAVDMQTDAEVRLNGTP
ncbi:MAG: galactokinase family protein [Oscillospiraceae bacterium]